MIGKYDADMLEWYGDNIPRDQFGCTPLTAEGWIEGGWIAHGDEDKEGDGPFERAEKQKRRHRLAEARVEETRKVIRAAEAALIVAEAPRHWPDHLLDRLLGNRGGPPISCEDWETITYVDPAHWPAHLVNRLRNFRAAAAKDLE